MRIKVYDDDDGVRRFKNFERDEVEKLKTHNELVNQTVNVTSKGAEANFTNVIGLKYDLEEQSKGLTRSDVGLAPAASALVLEPKNTKRALKESKSSEDDAEAAPSYTYKS